MTKPGDVDSPRPQPRPTAAALREAGPASRADLTRRTGLSRTTVSSLVAELEPRGRARRRESGAAPSPRGGRPRLLSFNRSAGAVLGVDFGKRHLGHRRAT